MATNVWGWQAQDKTPFYAQSWPVEAPKAAIALVHGFGEHIGRYEHVARFFNGLGYSFFGFDMRGHGQSGGPRGHAPSMNTLFEDITRFLAEVGQRADGVPIILYGHSMGGGLVLAYSLKHNPGVKAVLATSPWIQLAFQPPAFMVFLGRLTRFLAPSFSQPNNLNPEHLSHDPEVVKGYIADPLVVTKISSANGIGMLELGNWLNNYQGTFPKPLLLMHGLEDHITSPKASAAFSERVKGDITLQVFPEGYHELHNEPFKEEVLDVMGKWVNGLNHPI